ncbi:hypothetical protein [Allokutzneria albata]|uniref:Uncharacterized protein n=1 Tax=Allokutzneria albata TaxID=211114 RepID=A0A1G9TJA3_ALLAB|nr:hypothetical protein [Allokutzneria albata]SDM47733.1 hypothetical protein SAMN04489726_1822 [Allokutzneria albata]
MRVSLIAAVVFAAGVSTGGTAVAETTAAPAAKASCSVVALYNGMNVYDKSNKPVETLARGARRSSSCTKTTYDSRSVVFLAGGRTYVRLSEFRLDHGA